MDGLRLNLGSTSLLQVLSASMQKIPIPILGEFKVTLRCYYKRVRATFLVLDGYRAAVKLGLVEIKNE
jgi:hypothetical protein